ncbi:MAG TPA: DEAD/DEAH box helicase [Holophaga sp.]|nr:DEAD/DEAH box helicase [Holophaga sp.]HPS68230.1 DEAD/DEAH box helicase [Holophaga sp.]
MNTSTFAAMGCSEPFLAALDRRGFTAPTPVQEACFQPGLEGRDLLVQSRTGSGKTLAFGLPLMHRLTPDKHPQVLILTPTRELAQQVADELCSVQPRLATALLVGGLSYVPQLKALHFGASVIVGTPGRVMDHLDRESLDLSKVSMVVLDECDEMLNMGFIEDVEHILSRIPENPQTYLFSATLPAPIASLAKRFLKDPFRIQLGESGGATQHADITHTPCLVAEHLQTKALVNFLLLDEPSSALIFTKMKQQTETVAEALRDAGLAADYLHGDLNQGARNRIMTSFKEGKLRYLVATDVAARGIDVENMPLVVHMGIPTQFENYIHRSGRTGRAGAKGTSMALVNFKESRILLAWARRGGLQLEWRGIPTQGEIREARARRLAERVGAQEAPAFLDLAGTLLSERDPAALVAALLSLIEDEAHGGFDIPDAPSRTEPRREKRTYAPRPGEKPGWTPEARRERPPRPHGKTAGTFEDRPRGPKRPGFRQAEDRFKPERRTGGKFFKKKG